MSSMRTYIRRNAPEQNGNCCTGFLYELFSELFMYLILFLLFLFLSSIVAVYFFTGFGLIFLLLPIAGIIYYFFWKKKAKPIHMNQAFNLNQLVEMGKLIENCQNNSQFDLEQLRVPLLRYSNLICQRYQLELLDDAVFNLEQYLSFDDFDLEYLHSELKADIKVAMIEYRLQGIKIPESYMILLSVQKLTRSNVELAIQAIFQTVAMHDEEIIVSEDRNLALLLQNHINEQ